MKFYPRKKKKCIHIQYSLEKLRKYLKVARTKIFLISLPILSLYLNYCYQLWVDRRGGSRAATASGIEIFVALVNGFQLLTVLTKGFVLDIVVVLNILSGNAGFDDKAFNFLEALFSKYIVSTIIFLYLISFISFYLLISEPSLFIYLFICLFIYLFIHLFIHLLIYCQVSLYLFIFFNHSSCFDGNKIRCRWPLVLLTIFILV